ncbi:hypothetical protein ELD05_09790 [Caldicellulosiruptor changbaiensis]|uniref:AAA+ ATPase domain-containing protein n=1 Tax=Caldicellulosiruptor changbaiensis TaxID=1222016 RepID=A0A3T0D722_9FIRM|nr:hypothetical protein [Caldicellulosiruptor changbaiensis]AZT90910.1 hypothetical protein ELD05_09790 [Caldicellulosiruptor changbaiensis]
MSVIPLGKFNKFYRDYYLNAYNKGLEIPAILISSAAGIGKTESIHQLAREIAERLNLEFLDTSKIRDMLPKHLKPYETGEKKAFIFHNVNLSIIEPIDFQGLPAKEDGKTIYYPPAWVVLMVKNPGILFLDEITNIQRADMFSALHKVIAEKCVGDVRLHPQVHIVSACNPPEFSELANDLPESLVNRFQTIQVVFDKDAWVNYMSDKWREIPQHVFEYIGRVMAESGISKIKGTQNYLTPRSAEYFIKACIVNGINFRTPYNTERREFVSFLAESFFGADKDKCSKIIHYLTVSGEILNALKEGDFETVKARYEGLDNFDKLVMPIMLVSYLPQSIKEFNKILKDQKVFETFKKFADILCRENNQNMSNMIYAIFSREMHDEKLRFKNWDDFREFLGKSILIGGLFSDILGNGLNYQNTIEKINEIEQMRTSHLGRYLNYSVFEKEILNTIVSGQGKFQKNLKSVFAIVFNTMVESDKLKELLTTDEAIEGLLGSIKKS